MKTIKQEVDGRTYRDVQHRRAICTFIEEVYNRQRLESIPSSRLKTPRHPR